MLAAESQRTDKAEGSQGSTRKWPDWYAALAKFRNPHRLRATWQLINTVVPYFGLWYLMVRSVQLGYSYVWTLLLALVAAAFLVRMFILFHDCTHGSFFASKRVNTIVGNILGVLVFTSFEDWRFSHLRHHATNANLDARGFGDIWTLTRAEYESAPKVQKFFYRLYRSPVVLFGLGALSMLLFIHRFPTRTVKWKERLNVLLTNLLIVGVALAAAHFLGWRTYLMIQLPVVWFAAAAGIWLFYVQHQFSKGYWAHKAELDPLRASLEGSSFYKLPAVLRWFSGNIGYHHIHHLNAQIPNYHLKECHEAIPALQAAPPLTIATSLSCVRLKLWDEEEQEMTPFP